jgi:hypothetical protein
MSGKTPCATQLEKVVLESLEVCPLDSSADVSISSLPINPQTIFTPRLAETL